MAAAYYTSQFEPGSLPAMLQCASRSRRLKAMIQDLQCHSNQWPRSESRGFHESILEAVAPLCLREMEYFSNTKVPIDNPNGPATVITAIEQLLHEHGCSIQGNGSGFANTSEELKATGQMEAAPDSMPYLWSLLTELCGSRSLYCDRTARVVLAILLYAQSTQ
ncbi:hypothetical protein BKA66DRAFT_192892 [Pyrenochaeta sp. MPI-SDFR-AT-0127]|nr:hypothetical protein BKA66DRAFT_192892 [Pyrenochaeta sp. MPI-SDFR-AT-0127]